MNIASSVSELKRGRPVVMHKSGLPLKEVRSNAKSDVSAAKAALKAHDSAHKTLEKNAATATKTEEKLKAALEKATSASYPDNATKKAAIANAKAAVSDAIKAYKEAAKAVQVSTNGRVKLEKAWMNAESKLAAIG